MSVLLRAMLASWVALLIVGCVPPDVQPPREASTVVVGMSAERGRQLIDSVFWYTGVQPDSVVADAGMLRVVLPADALGHGVQMEDVGCRGREPGRGAVQTLAAHAWASRDAGIVRDTILVVFSKATMAAQRASIWGSASRACSAGPAMYYIAVDDLPWPARGRAP